MTSLRHRRPAFLAFFPVLFTLLMGVATFGLFISWRNSSQVVIRRRGLDVRFKVNEPGVALEQVITAAGAGGGGGGTTPGEGESWRQTDASIERQERFSLGILSKDDTVPLRQSSGQVGSRDSKRHLTTDEASADGGDKEKGRFDAIASRNENNESNTPADDDDSMAVLGSSSASNTTVFQRTTPRELRVICLMIKNEKEFLKDWIDFHLLAGWNRFVIYDHESTDNITEVIKEYPPGVIDYTYFVWDQRQRSFIQAQNHVFEECFRRYWWDAQVIGNFDLDEYVFPGKEHMKQPDPFMAAMQAMGVYQPGSGKAVSARMRFNFFGLNGHLQSPTQGVVAHYTRRAAELPHEIARANITQEMKEACKRASRDHGFDKTRAGWQYFLCETHVAAYPNKRLHFPNDQVEVVRPTVHYSTGAQILRSFRKMRRTFGFACNHLFLRSLDAIREKGQKNANNFYKILSALPMNHLVFQYYELVEDRLAIEFLESARRRVNISSPDFRANLTRLGRITPQISYPFQRGLT